MRGFVAVLTALTALTVGTSTEPVTAQQPEPGGTLRGGITSFDFTSGFDPTGEYLGFSWGIFSNLLVRTLVTYRHVEGAEGAELVADLATEVPSPTDDGLTYTFHLKDGVRFGPPLDREITSYDIDYAFARINCGSCAAQYPFYYDKVIRGMHPRSRTLRPQPGRIEGIETPDDDTIVFHLEKPTGDFLHRLALPATGPIPSEVARCHTGPGQYGRFVVSSGPYMIEGSEELDPTAGCRAMRQDPISGFDPSRSLRLVRNPNYDPSTDDPAIRSNDLDGFEFNIVRDAYELFDRVLTGELDIAFQDPPPEVVDRYERDPDLRDRLHSDAADRTWYITMNLTRPPFDDVHVRRALNLALDKESVRASWGGEAAGEMATHILPPALTAGSPTGEEYDPYATGYSGDVDAARSEMAASRYDTDGDGLCDRPVCTKVVMTSRGRCSAENRYSRYFSCRQWPGTHPVVRRALAAIGIDVEISQRPHASGYTSLQNVERGVRISMVPGWGKDYLDPCSFMCWLFDGRTIVCQGNLNYSLVGATEETKRECDAPGRFGDLPNVDADIDRCQELFIGDARAECWRDLDRKLMEEVVPWVPYLWGNNIRIVGPAVTRYEFDQFSAEAAFAHLAVDPARQN